MLISRTIDHRSPLFLSKYMELDQALVRSDYCVKNLHPVIIVNEINSRAVYRPLKYTETIRWHSGLGVGGDAEFGPGNAKDLNLAQAFLPARRQE